MKIKILNRLILIFSMLFISCNEPKENQLNTQKQILSDDSSEKIVNSIGEVLTTNAKKLTLTWKEYNTVDSLINKYYNILPTIALDKAEELSIATKELKDSIKIVRFQQPDIKIRLNVLYNTTLRLADMKDIPRIDKQEIKNEVANTVNAFSAINSKINNIVSQIDLEKEIDINK